MNNDASLYSKQSTKRLELEQKFIGERIALLIKQKRELSELDNDQQKRRQSMISEFTKEMQNVNKIKTNKSKDSERAIPLPPLPQLKEHKTNNVQNLPTPRDSNLLKSIENNIKHSKSREQLIRKTQELNKVVKNVNLPTKRKNENNLNKAEPNTSKYFESDDDFEIFKKLKPDENNKNENQEPNITKITLLPASVEQQIEVSEDRIKHGRATEVEKEHLETLKQKLADNKEKNVFYLSDTDSD